MLFFLVCREFPAEEPVLQFYRKETCSLNKNCPAVLWQHLFQCLLSTWLSQCSVPLQKFQGSEKSTYRCYIPQTGTKGKYFIKRQTRNFGSLNHTSLYHTGVFNLRVNPTDIWHLSNAIELGFWFLLGIIIRLVNFYRNPKLPQKSYFYNSASKD